MQEITIPENILSKVSKGDPELILQQILEKKFGKRYLEYRINYNKMLNDDLHSFLPSYPITVVLELVNRCNLECVMCYQGYRNDAIKHTINEEMLDKIFYDFEKNKLSALMLSASEPLLFNNIETVLKKAKKANIMDIFLFTNGALLDEERSKMILDSSITRLFVSLDAATQKTYDAVRVPVSKRLLKENRLKYVEKNIINFITLKDKNKSELPLTRVSFVALEENSSEVKQFKKKWKNIVDSVEIQRETSMEVYDKLKPENLSKLSEHKLENYNCNKPWGDLAIYSDGSVGPCCNLVGRKTPIGNIKNHSIKEIWEGAQMTLIREGFKKNKPPNHVCQACLESQKTNI